MNVTLHIFGNWLASARSPDFSKRSFRIDAAIIGEDYGIVICLLERSAQV